MNGDYTSIHEIARLHTEPFVKGLDAGLEAIKQREELSSPITFDDVSARSDVFHIATNRLAMSDEIPESYGQTKYEIMGMGVISALEEAAIRSKGNVG